MAGAFYFDPSTKKVMAVPAEEAHVAEQAGWVGVSKEQADKFAAGARAAKDAGSLTGQAKTFGESAVKGGVDMLTALPRAASAAAHAAGLTSSDPLAGMTGEDAVQTGAFALGQQGGATDLQAAAGAQQYQQRAEQRAEANPGTATAGTLVGGIVGGAPLGILGGALKAGTVAELGGGLAARLAGGVVEGGAIGGTAALSDAAAKAQREGSELTGEQAFGSLALGLLTGSAIGGGISGLGEALGAAKTGLGRIFGSKEAGAAEGASQPGIVAKVMGAASGKDPDVIHEMLEQSDAGRARRSLAVFDGDKTRESAEREIRSHINQIETATKNLTPEWRELKASNVAATIDTSPEAAAQQQAMVTDRLATMREKVDEMIGDKDVYGDRGNLNRIQRALNVAEKNANAAIERGDAADLFVTMDDLKKQVGTVAAKTKGNFGVAADKETAVAATDLYEGLRQDLQHPAWGKAGEMQASVNDAFTDYLGTKRLFDNRFMTETGKEGWGKTYGADPAKIGSYVRGLLDPAKDLDHGIIEQHIASTKKLAQALAGAGELTAAKQAELSAITSSAEAFEKQIGTASEALSATNKLDMLKGGAQHGIGISALAGHAFGGPVGGSLGAILGAVSNPGAMVQRLAVMERLAGPVQQRAREALDSLFAGVGKPVAGALEAATAVRAPAALSAFELFTGKHGSPEQAYPIRLQELAAAPQNIADRVGAVLGQDGIQDPAAALAAFASANKAVAFLQAHIPVGLHDMQSLTPMTTKQTPAQSDIAEFASLWSAVMRPRDVIAGIPHGTVSSGQMQAIQQVYPRMFTWLQSEAMDRVQKADEQGHEIPLRQRDILDTLFDLGKAAGPTYTIEFAAKYGPRLGDGAQFGKRKPPTKGGDMGKSLATGTSSMLGGGA